MRRSPLARKSPLRRTRPQNRPAVKSPEEIAWKTPHWGRCQNCGRIDTDPLHGHHVIPRQTLARLGLPEFDPANRCDLCARCHMNHEFGQENRKLKLDKLPPAAVLYAAAHGLSYELERRYA